MVSEQERDAKKAGYDSAVAQLNQAKAQVGLDQADVDQYRALTQFKQVVAPYAGTITERHIDIGNLVTAAPIQRRSTAWLKTIPSVFWSLCRRAPPADIKLGSWSN